MREDVPDLFRFFNEIGIINQLANAILQSRLPKGVLVSHFTLLNHLVRVRDGSTPLELALAFQVPKTTMTHSLSGLKERAWVEERPNPSDARSKQIWLTGAGRQFRKEMIQSLGADLAGIERALPGLAVSLIPDLTRVREHLDASRDCG